MRPGHAVAATRLARSRIVRWKQAGNALVWETSRHKGYGSSEDSCRDCGYRGAGGRGVLPGARASGAGRARVLAPRRKSQACPPSRHRSHRSRRANRCAVAGGARSCATGRAAKAAPAAPQPDPGMPFERGEVLDYTADVAKVSNVANLRLQVAENEMSSGKTAWHLQAFAHTKVRYAWYLSWTTSSTRTATPRR